MAEAYPPSEPNPAVRGQYLTLKALDFFDQQLSGGRISWRRLAGELRYKDKTGVLCSYSAIDVDKFEADGGKLDQSSTKLLLRHWENSCGGCDLAYLKDCLRNIGRRDILTDLKEYFDDAGVAIVGPRSCHNVNDFANTPAQSAPLPLPGDGSCYVFEGTVIIRGSGQVQINPNPQKKESVTGFPRERETQNLGSSKSRNNSNVNRNSDPVRRKDVSPSHEEHSWSSGSTESITGPRNLKETVSAQELRSTNQKAKPLPSQYPPKLRREEEQCEAPGDYGSLRSGPGQLRGQSVREAAGREGASPGHQYLIVSSSNEEDQRLSRKLAKIIGRTEPNVKSLHSLQPNERISYFSSVDFVIVIYTENYKKEIQTPGTPSHRIFQMMKFEYADNGNVNKRFTPVYEVSVITELPDCLIGKCPRRDYIMALLSNNCSSSQKPSSAPTQNGRVGDEGRDGACGGAAARHTNNTSARGEPHIVREFHTPQNQPRTGTSGEKKEQPSKFFKLKIKKGK